MLLTEMIGSYDEVFKYVDRMPQFDVPEGETQESWLRKKLQEGLDEKFGPNPPKEVLERLETELSVIEPLGFASYFLVVSDICNAARSMGVPVGPGRGSAAGSLVAYLTGIIAINPLEHGLLFERFLNPERVNPPDIDLDFDDRQRDKVIDYVTHKYGAEYTSQVNTFGKIKAKAAVKDANRILGYPFALGDKITKAMPPDVMGKGVPLDKIFDSSHERYGEGQEFRQLVADNPDVARLSRLPKASRLIRGTGVHACAFILSSTPLLDLVPMHKRDKDGMIIAGFAYPQLEEMGLMKMDFLGLRNLGIMDHCIKIIKANRGIDVDLKNIALDDKTTYEMLARGDTLGVFQLDGTAMRSLLRLMGPTCFDDIVAVLALYRPGPMGANAHISYAQRKNNREPIIPIHPELKEDLDEILAPTYTSLCTRSRSCRSPENLPGIPWVAPTCCAERWVRKRSTSWRKTSSPSRRVCVNTVTPTMPSRLCGTSWSPSLDTPLTNPTLLAMDLSRTGRLTSRPTTRLNTALLC
ncbi:DNA polymerase III alpha subunit [Cutibacterium acnes JCM 18920]|nr:DNA polymerase III alpha subunit [Cutibacterium acnes JCM 18920]